METKYKLKDLRETGFMEEHEFENKREILNFLLDDFLNFRMDEHKIENLSLTYMLNNLELEIIVSEKEIEEGYIVTCKDCGKKFNSLDEGSTDEPDLCDSCWVISHAVYVNILMLNLKKAGDFREVLEYINEELYNESLSLKEMIKKCNGYLINLSIRELKDLIYEKPNLINFGNYLTEEREKDYIEEKRERDVFFNKDTKEIYCEYLDELSEKEEREETKKELAFENKIDIEKIGFMRFSPIPLIYQK